MPRIPPVPAPTLPDEPRPSARAARLVLLIVALATAAIDLGTKAWAFAALDAKIVSAYELAGQPHPVLHVPEDATATVVREFPVVAPGAAEVIVIDGCFNFHASMNTGAVFGILSGRTAWVMVLTCVALGLIGWILWKADPRRVWMHAAFGLILGGALGNLYDRAAYAGVRDFILWYYKTPANAWPTFNIADAALVIGIGLIILMEWRTPTEAADAPASAPAATPDAGSPATA